VSSLKPLILEAPRFGYFYSTRSIPNHSASSLAALRCQRPDRTPLNVRRFDGKAIGGLHNGEIVKAFGKGLKVKAIRKAPIPIAQEPT
jgi:hypothetical protein